MHCSLSLCLCVHNAQGEIAALIHSALEAAAELAPRFEILVLDTGSTDATVEIAHDLAQMYPQLRVVRQSWEVDRAGVVERALATSRGEAIVFLAAESTFDVRDLRKLWRELEAADIVLARAARPSRPLRSMTQRILPDADRSAICELWLMRRQAATLLAAAAATLTDFADQASAVGWQVRWVELPTRQNAAENRKKLAGPRFLRRARSGWLHSARTTISGN
ncbi:MAG: glycosyltransferase [Pirellulales bacterium]|nr:glycosyltransferase [Pirellulales bacterium]